MESVPQKEWEGFEEVWRRVVDAGEEPRAVPWGRDAATPTERPKADSPKLLRELMDAERAAQLFYTALSKRCADRGRSALTRMAWNEGNHLRELQLEYFLLLGENYVPIESCPRQTDVLNALRMAYLSEKKSGAEYLAAAEQDDSRAELYRKLAGEEMCHAETLRKLIEKALTGRRTINN